MDFIIEDYECSVFEVETEDEDTLSMIAEREAELAELEEMILTGSRPLNEANNILSPEDEILWRDFCICNGLG